MGNFLNISHNKRNNPHSRPLWTRSIEMKQRSLTDRDLERLVALQPLADSVGMGEKWAAIAAAAPNGLDKELLKGWCGTAGPRAAVFTNALTAAGWATYKEDKEGYCRKMISNSARLLVRSEMMVERRGPFLGATLLLSTLKWLSYLPLLIETPFPPSSGDLLGSVLYLFSETLDYGVDEEGGVGTSGLVALGEALSAAEARQKSLGL